MSVGIVPDKVPVFRTTESEHESAGSKDSFRINELWPSDYGLPKLGCMWTYKNNSVFKYSI